MQRARPENGQRGSVVIWSVVLIPACFAVIGLVLDGGVILRARSDAYSLAGAAAREAAQEISSDELVEGRPVLDPIAARQTALDYLTARSAKGDVVVAPDSVTVTVRTTAELQILTTASGRTVHLSAHAVAHPKAGPG
jgi:hypothetical protein